MKLLLSAYACEPNKGSEPGVGWEWALEIARLGHEVWVLTRANNQSNIENELSKSTPIKNLKFLYYDLPAWTLTRWWKKRERRIHLYYLLWQWGAYLFAKKIHATEQFDRVHHITFVTLRQPSFMGNLGIPFIFGPVSGGERAPIKLRKGYSLGNKILEVFKDFSNSLIKIDPLMRRTFRQAERIYVTSKWNISLLPRKYREKTSILLPIGFNSNELPDLGKPSPKSETNGSFKVLYLGNLLYMKGMHLGIPAFARLLLKRPDARLTLVGSGPDGQHWRTIAENLGIQDQIDWIPRQDRQTLSTLYKAHDVFIYPTVQDPGGIVILEALAHGLPVVCLSYKGAGIMIDETCGMTVEIAGLSEEKTIQAMGDQLIQLAQNPATLKHLSNGALRKAKEFEWSAPVGRIYKKNTSKPKDTLSNPLKKSKMKVLFSAYACEPNKGSEPSVGWNWALETARLGHDVWVLTRTNNRKNIEDELFRNSHPSNLNFLYFDLPAWARWWKKGGRGIYFYYLLWQWGAYKVACRAHKKENFDRIHHITFGSIRLPSFMGRLGIPFIFGPVGGGEKAPWKLRMGFGIRGWVWDALRDISNLAIRFDPLMRATFRQAEQIYVKTPQSGNIIPKKFLDKVRCQFEIGIDEQKLSEVRIDKKINEGPFRILYVGRFLYLKGMHLGLAAFANVLLTIPDARLTLVGKGSDSQRWQQIAKRLNISQSIDWVPWVSQSELQPLYQNHDVFLFPSLHDSSGNVILEAMINSLPVICLDLGGPGVMVDNTFGRVIATAGQSESQVASALEAALIQCAKNPSLRLELGTNARNKAKNLTWSSTVAGIYEKRNNLDKKLASFV